MESLDLHNGRIQWVQREPGVHCGERFPICYDMKNETSRVEGVANKRCRNDGCGEDVV